MAFPSGGYVNGKFLGGLLGQTVNPVWSGVGADSIRVALYTDQLGVATSTDKNAQESYGVGAFAASQVTSAGYTAGGPTLTSPTFTTAGGIVKFTANAQTVLSGVTFTPRAAVIWDDTMISPWADPVIAVVDFGSNKPVVGGTFTVTWNVNNGIFYATY